LKTILSLFILFITIIFCDTIKRDYALLIELNPNIANLNIVNKKNKIVDNVLLNNVLTKNKIYKIEKWNKIATKNDIYNGINFSNIYRIFISKENNYNLETIKINLELSEMINIVEYDYYRKVDYTPNDPRYNNQWFLQEINSNDAWSVWNTNIEIPGDRSVILASVDTGVNWQHEDIVGNLWQNLNEDADGDGRTIEYINGEWVLDPGDLNGIDDDNWDNNMSTLIDDLIGWDVSGTTYGDNNPDVPNNGSWAHGTHVAGLLAASSDNNIGIASTAFNASIMSVKCTNEDEDSGYIYNGYDGILYASKAGYYSSGFTIINCSWGGEGFSIFEQEMINMCAEEYNALIFGASGNENIEQAHYPSSYENIISVTALGQNNSWNNWATYHHTVDLGSPGESIQSCVNNGSGYSSWSGTSMATPVAASVAGLMKAMHPNWDAKQVETMIVGTANPIIYQVNPESYLENKLGSGRVDALNAIITPLFPKIDLSEIDIYIPNDTNNEINIGETIEFTGIFFNDPNWGSANNPSIAINCNSNQIEIQNPLTELTNIPSGEATINFNPIVIHFSDTLEPDLYNCELSFLSNEDSYIHYKKKFIIDFIVNQIPFISGDINQDDEVDILDVIICVNIIIELFEPSNYEILSSDINSDNLINVQDIILLVNIILN